MVRTRNAVKSEKKQHFIANSYIKSITLTSNLKIESNDI